MAKAHGRTKTQLEQEGGRTCGDGADSRARATAASPLVCGKKGDHQ